MSKIIVQWRGYVFGHQRSKVADARLRAKALGLPSRFSQWDWASSIAYWRGCCPYCGMYLLGTSPGFLTLDHFIPLDRGGGTTFDNCLPACIRCNGLKQNSDPWDWLNHTFGHQVGWLIWCDVQDFFCYQRRKAVRRGMAR